jgi:hypothetical protein
MQPSRATMVSLASLPLRFGLNIPKARKNTMPAKVHGTHVFSMDGSTLMIPASETSASHSRTETAVKAQDSLGRYYRSRTSGTGWKSLWRL